MNQILMKFIMVPVIAIILSFAAFLEVYGDDRIRLGFDDRIRLGFKGRVSMIFLGVLILAGYGLAVNTVNLVLRGLSHSEQWNLAGLLGIYVGFFASVSVLWDKRQLHEWYWNKIFAVIPTSVLIGLGLIIVGGVFIQWGSRIANLIRISIGRP